MRHERKADRGPGDRKVGPRGDAVNLLLFIGSLALILALLAILDPTVKDLFIQLLP